jgi:hypothetical protein
MATPGLVQNFSSFLNTANEGVSGNAFKFSAPNPCLSGNLVILEISCDYKSGRTVTIADNTLGSNTWTLGGTCNTGTGGVMTFVYFSSNSAAGTQSFTVTFDAALLDAHFTYTEVYNIALSSAQDGSAAISATSAGPTIGPGTLTTTVDGDFIYLTAMDALGQNENTTNLTKPTGFTFLSGSLQWGYCSAFMVQTTHGAITPTIAVAGSTDTFNCIAIAFKSATAGSQATGMRVVHCQQELYNRTQALMFPCSGNLLVVATTFQSSAVNFSALSSSPTNTWTKAVPADTTDYAQIWYAVNVTNATDTLKITPTVSANFLSIMMYDIAGAAAAPYDSVAGIPQITKSITTGTPSSANFTGMPLITPSTPNGLVIAFCTNGTGPTLACTSPSGAAFMSVTYTGMTDVDTMENADGHAVYKNPTTAQISFNWTNTLVNESSNACAIAFKAATGATQQGTDTLAPGATLTNVAKVMRRATDPIAAGVTIVPTAKNVVSGKVTI